MPDLPPETANWVIAGLVALACFFLRGLPGTVASNKQAIALLKQQAEWQADYNKDMTNQMKKLADAVQAIQQDCAVNHRPLEGPRK